MTLPPNAPLRYSNSANQVPSKSHMLKARLFDLSLTILGRLPLPWLRFFGHALGILLWYSRSRMALVTLENIQICFPELSHSKQRTLAKNSLHHTGKTILETTFAWKAQRRTCLESIKSVENENIVTDALNRGRGVIFIIPHLGNWEMINHYLGEHYGLTHMSLPFKHPGINNLIDSYRARTGTRFVNVGSAGIRAQMRILKQGGCIGTMPDQEPSVHSGSFTDFFDVRTLTSTLVSRFAEKTECETIVAVCKRTASGFHIDFAAAEIGAAHDPLLEMNNAISSAIRNAPEQYLWSYKRFRTREAGEQERYQFPQHPVRVAIEHTALKLFLGASSLIRSSLRPALAALVAGIFRVLHLKAWRVSTLNISSCFPSMPANEQQKLAKHSLIELINTGLEIQPVWSGSDGQFSSLCISVEGLEHMMDGATLVLTPPLGNREAVMRYLGEHFKSMEYYHPVPSTALDRLIRKQRTRMGISLVEHTNEGLAQIMLQLSRGNVATLCPDQQPRLRGGEFIPFFAMPALTTTVMGSILRELSPQVVFGVGIREMSGIRIHFHPLEYDAELDVSSLLQCINKQLEEIISTHITQYRWADKRLNILPPAMKKLYG